MFWKANTDLSRQIKECEKEVKQHKESDQYEIDVGKHFFELEQLLKQKANECIMLNIDKETVV